MISNRESARRSRKKKQAHLQDLERQVTNFPSTSYKICLKVKNKLSVLYNCLNSCQVERKMELALHLFQLWKMLNVYLYFHPFSCNLQGVSSELEQ